jgi:hypothetical protein
VITADDVRRLLVADDDAVLIVIEGRVDIVAPDALDTDDYRGALQVTTRADLVAERGQVPSDRDIAEQAAALDSALSELGG